MISRDSDRAKGPVNFPLFFFNFLLYKNSLSPMCEKADQD